MKVATIGLDLAESVFHIHGVAQGETIGFCLPLRRSQVFSFLERLKPCLMGMEACGTSHYWARELTKLGHDVKLIASV